MLYHCMGVFRMRDVVWQGCFVQMEDNVVVWGFSLALNSIANDFTWYGLQRCNDCKVMLQYFNMSIVDVFQQILLTMLKSF